MTQSTQALQRSATHAPRVSVVVPTYNEAANLPHVFGLMPDVHEVIVVDGRSTDGTIETARALRPDVRIVLQNRRGKGNAMACGFAAVTGDIVVMLDADGSAHPGEIELFVDALVAGADFAKGSRFLPEGGSDDITALRRAGNWFLNTVANILFRTRFTDLCYGYNAFWVHCLPALALDASGENKDQKLWGDGFEIETIINTRMAKARLSISEVPSFEHPRLHGTTNLNTFRDGFRVLWALALERFRTPAPMPSGAPVGVVVPRAEARGVEPRQVEVGQVDAQPDTAVAVTAGAVPVPDTLSGEVSEALIEEVTSVPAQESVVDGRRRGRHVAEAAPTRRRYTARHSARTAPPSVPSPRHEPAEGTGAHRAAPRPVVVDVTSLEVAALDAAGAGVEGDRVPAGAQRASGA